MESTFNFPTKFNIQKDSKNNFQTNKNKNKNNTNQNAFHQSNKAGHPEGARQKTKWS